MNEMRIRQTDILLPSNFKITIAGAGGIGSWTALALAKMGYADITVYDFDNVEEHNLGTQFFKVDDLQKPKVQALKENISAFANVDIKIKEQRADEPIKTDILILAVDSMSARKQIFEQAEYQFMIDARMGGQIFTLYSVYPYNTVQYEKTLHSDEDAIQEPCTAKAIAYNVFGIASFISCLVKKYDKGEHVPSELSGDYINLLLHKSQA